MNNYIKRVVHQTVRDRFPHLTSIGKSNFVQVVKTDEVHEQALHDERRAAYDEILLKAVGLRRVIDGLFSSNKALVGHNLLSGWFNAFRSHQSHAHIS